MNIWLRTAHDWLLPRTCLLCLDPTRGFELCGGCRCRAYAAHGDYLQEDPACRYQPTGKRLQFETIHWSPEAKARLERIPLEFIRGKVRQGLEAYAQRQGIDRITADVMKEALAGEGRSKIFGKMPRVSKPD